MNTGLVERITRSVLYDGFLRSPGQVSVPGGQARCALGVIYPPDALMPAGATSELGTQCLVRAPGSAALDLRVRFLHVTPADLDGGLAGQPLERTVVIDAGLMETCRRPICESFRWPGSEALGGTRRTIHGDVTVNVEPAGQDGDWFRIDVSVANSTPAPRVDGLGRRDLLAQSLVATHAVLHVPGGEFASLLDPPPGATAAAGRCRHRGLWPVLIGAPGARDAMLAAPLRLSDYPRTELTDAAARPSLVGPRRKISIPTRPAGIPGTVASVSHTGLAGHAR